MGNSTCGCGPRRNKFVLYNIQNTDWANAVTNVSLAGVQMLHQQEPDLINQIVTSNGYIAIHIAVKRKHFDLFAYLLQYGGNINALGGENGNSCLHLAVMNQDTKIIDELFRCDCDDTLTNKNGKTPSDLIDDIHFRRQYMRAKNKHRMSSQNTQNIVDEDAHDRYFSLAKALDSILETSMDGYIDTIDCDSDDDKDRYHGKPNEIETRDPYVRLTEFSTRIGCEVDEIAHCVQTLDTENKLESIWDKWIHKKRITKCNDLLKLLYGLTVLTLKQKADKHGYYTENNGRPPPEPIRRLANRIYKMLPKYKSSRTHATSNGRNESKSQQRRVLTREEFTDSFHLYLYDAHEQLVSKYKDKYKVHV